MARLSPDALTTLAVDSLRRAGALPATAESTARALVYADLRGLSSHGVSRLPMYCAQLRNGRVDPAAQAAIVADRGAAILIDGADGLAYPACDLAVSTLAERTKQFGSAVAGVKRSHHFGVGAAHLAALGTAGMVSRLRSAIRRRRCPRGAAAAPCSGPTRSPPCSRVAMASRS